MQRHICIVQLLMRRIEGSFHFVVDSDGVQNDFTNGIAIAVFVQTHVELAGIIARVGIERYLIDFFSGVEPARDLDVIGVGIGIQKPIDDRHLFVIGKNIDFRFAGNQFNLSSLSRMLAAVCWRCP